MEKRPPGLRMVTHSKIIYLVNFNGSTYSSFNNDRYASLTYQLTGGAGAIKEKPPGKVHKDCCSTMWLEETGLPKQF